MGKGEKCRLSAGSASPLRVALKASSSRASSSMSVAKICRELWPLLFARASPRAVVPMPEPISRKDRAVGAGQIVKTPLQKNTPSRPVDATDRRWSCPGRED